MVASVKGVVNIDFAYQNHFRKLPIRRTILSRDIKAVNYKVQR